MNTPRHEGRVALQEITASFNDRQTSEHDRRTVRWVGAIIRKRLGLKTQKSHGIFVIPESEMGKLPRLYERYGLGAEEHSVRPPDDEEALVG